VNARLVEEIANTVLYEGYLLYPYRASALKNRHRFNFGVVVAPHMAERDMNERSWVGSECLLHARPDVRMTVRARFLQLLESGSSLSAGWQEAIDREVRLEVAVGELVAGARTQAFEWGAETAGQEPVRGQLEVTSEIVDDGPIKIRIVIANLTRVADQARFDWPAVLKQSLVSVHAILSVSSGGDFVSLLDPPVELRGAAAGCRNLGLWPVMVGDANERDAMLASPIILYDYPQIAPESAGDFFDGTEIDEMLALRVLTMTDEEKEQARHTDARARALLDRTEELSSDRLLKLHGVLRGLRLIGEPL